MNLEDPAELAAAALESKVYPKDIDRLSSVLIAVETADGILSEVARINRTEIDFMILKKRSGTGLHASGKVSFHGEIHFLQNAVLNFDPPFTFVFRRFGSDPEIEDWKTPAIEEARFTRQIEGRWNDQ